MARNYEAAQVMVIVGGVPMEGFTPDSFVEITYNTENFALQIGPDGTGSRSKTNDLSARITLHFQQTSPSNDVLTGLFFADGESPVGAPVPMMIKDNSGRTLFVTETAWILKIPDVSFSTALSERAWMFETDALVPFVGGNQ